MGLDGSGDGVVWFANSMNEFPPLTDWSSNPRLGIGLMPIISLPVVCTMVSDSALSKVSARCAVGVSSGILSFDIRRRKEPCRCFVGFGVESSS